MPDKQAIEQEISRLQGRLDVYMNAGRLSEAERISQEINNLLNQLRS